VYKLKTCSKLAHVWPAHNASCTARRAEGNAKGNSEGNAEQS
jgi:hypothetical protein